MITQELLDSLFKYMDGKLYWKKITNMSRVKVGDEAGFMSKQGYKCIRIYNKIFKQHRIIFFMHHGFFPEFVDHIDGNKLNNNIDNLRVASRIQNQQNAKIRADNKSGIKGVSWYKKTNTWRAVIKINGKFKHLGLFKDIDDAKNAVVNARNLYHGIFANHG
jgi:hypothetical protein